MTTTKTKTKRQQLGEAIEHLRGEQNMNRHNLADKTRVTVRDVERWERGELCPSAQEWQRLRAVYHQLNAAHFRELFRAAAVDQLAVEDAKDDDAGQRTSDLDAAIHLLIDAVPALRSLTITVDDAGDVAVSYKTREVRIIEDEGKLKIARSSR